MGCAHAGDNDIWRLTILIMKKIASVILGLFWIPAPVLFCLLVSKYEFPDSVLEWMEIGDCPCYFLNWCLMIEFAACSFENWINGENKSPEWKRRDGKPCGGRIAQGERFIVSLPFHPFVEGATRGWFMGVGVGSFVLGLGHRFVQTHEMIDPGWRELAFLYAFTPVR